MIKAKIIKKNIDYFYLEDCYLPNNTKAKKIISNYNLLNTMCYDKSNRSIKHNFRFRKNVNIVLKLIFS